MAAALESDGKMPRRAVTPWRAFGLFWACAMALLVGTGAVVQWLGPVAVAAPAHAIAPHPPADAVPEAPAPWRAYAAGFDRAERGPRVAAVLAGIGLSAPEDAAAIGLAPTISLAMSPYAREPDAVLRQARAAGHEVLLGIPMEPQGFPLNDAGPLALLTGLAPAENADRLERLLSGSAGYAGLTNAIGSTSGERFRGTAGMRDVLMAAKARGLMFLDAVPGGTLPVVGGLPVRGVDVAIDGTGDPAEVVRRLARLTEIARARGAAVGVLAVPTPNAVLRLAEWSNSLARQGVVLVPVSAMMRVDGEK